MTTQTSSPVLPENSAVLITGAGGAAAVTLIRALTGHARVVAADIDPLAVGLYLVPAAQRILLPRGDDPGFVDALLASAVEHRVGLVIPTVDIELRDVSAARGRFAEHGIRLLVETTGCLDLCLDKAALVARCADRVRVPRTVVLSQSTTAADLAGLGAPFIVKPRQGAGGRGFAVISEPGDLDRVPHDETMIAQENLPGTEYSIDVLCRPDGHVVAAVPRTRDKVDSGIAVAGRTVRDAGLESFGRGVAVAIGATGVINVQARRAVDGAPALLEVNARFPGTMTLTMLAGIDMPLLGTAAAFGASLPDRIDFQELAVVRHWADVAVPIDEYGVIGTGPPVATAAGAP
ncbi:MAG: ATP-grasp domain-containing protein [Jatrophihabitans sp.]